MLEDDGKCYELNTAGMCDQKTCGQVGWMAFSEKGKDSGLYHEYIQIKIKLPSPPYLPLQASINCYVRNLDTLKTECKCLPGNVTTADGHCYEPYSRGPCQLGSWLVFSQVGRLIGQVLSWRRGCWRRALI